MKILITGGTGFIGSAFTRLALKRGHQVAGLTQPGRGIPATLPAHPQLQWLRGTLDEAPWKEIAKYQADVCIHGAWITTPGTYLESPENYRFLESSQTFLQRILDTGTSHIFGLGTCIEYQITNQPLSETGTPAAPATTYSKCKDALRQWLEAEARKRGFTGTWGRVFYPYGPGEHPARLCSALIARLSAGETLRLKTPQSIKDYIFIEDLAEALLTVVDQRPAGIINLGTGTGVSVREIADQLGELLGRPELVQEQIPPELDAFPFVVADAGRLKSLGWQSRTNLRQGLSRLISQLVTRENSPMP
jgi:nucleoside-diphosphate-sugar epimerase